MSATRTASVNASAIQVPLVSVNPKTSPRSNGSGSCFFDLRDIASCPLSQREYTTRTPSRIFPRKRRLILTLRSARPTAPNVFGQLNVVAERASNHQLSDRGETEHPRNAVPEEQPD